MSSDEMKGMELNVKNTSSQFSLLSLLLLLLIFFWGISRNNAYNNSNIAELIIYGYYNTNII